MRLAPISIREADIYVLHHHRHHRPTGGRALFALAVEILRVCTDGTPNACSFLYGRCRRAAAALGYEKVITYTRQDESGISPTAAGFEQEALLPARSYSKSNVSRRRHDKTEPFPRIRWGIGA